MPDSFCARMKTTPDRGSAHTQIEIVISARFQCNGAKLHLADL